MANARGLVINGVILPDEPLHTHEGERVLITFLGSDNGTEGLARGDVDLSGRAPDPVDYIPPTESLAALLANAVCEQPIDAAAWNDALIAAVALRRDLTLLTTDGDFAAVPGLLCENWLR